MSAHVHMRAAGRIGGRPVCNTDAWAPTLTRNDDDVTCNHCLKIMGVKNATKSPRNVARNRPKRSDRLALIRSAGLRRSGSHESGTVAAGGFEPADKAERVGGVS